MFLEGDVSFCPQDPWIISGSVRHNIILNEELDERRYLEVLRCCALRDEVLGFKFGDLTEIGERGDTLSGG